MAFTKNKIYLLLGTALTLFYFSACSSSALMEKHSANSSYFNINLDTVKAGRFDTGKMWTFDFPPINYFNEEYSFIPTSEWFDNVRMSALRFATYCSASFVSEDGLVMTNHHCARRSVSDVAKEGEDLHTDGFYAETLDLERKVPGLFVDQLMMIKDVTSEVQNAIDASKDEKEKAKNKKNIISEIEAKYKEETGLRASVVALYNGGKYSLYGYKRYNDVRLVFAPETQLGFFGGDPDNFTYPRYNLDCSFFRVYDEEGKPLKTDHYFKWSSNGAAPGEPVFVVGNPGSTSRLNTFAQLEYNRDISYPYRLNLLGKLVQVYSELMNVYPDRKIELQDKVYSYANSQKAYEGILKGLRDPILMQRKKDFEKKFQNAVNSKPAEKEKYGQLWDKIAASRAQLRTFAHEMYLLSLDRLTTNEYFNTAKDLIGFAEKLSLPEDKKPEEVKGDELQKTIENIYPDSVDYEKENRLLRMYIDLLLTYDGNKKYAEEFTGGKSGSQAVNYILANTILIDKQKVIELAQKGSDAILNSTDPFIKYILSTRDQLDELKQKSSDITAVESNYVQELGRALFEVYGTSIPPDATFTLRIADGVVKGFPYNGTEAPPITTYYGMYDRYYSFNKEFPWSLPARWQNPPADFNLETPFNFVSTNDIIGGNSGSPVINKNAEVVGLAFDGNIQGLPGNFIFREEENRTVSVHSLGMIEALQDMYKAGRLTKELKSGKITE